MISIRKHLERLSGEDRLRKAFLAMVESVIITTRDRILVTDSEEHTWFCSSLDALQRRLREDSSPTNIEVVSALLTKTLEDHWIKLASQTTHREEELKRIIHLLAESAARLDAENKQFYVSLRTAVQSFQNISQIEDITYMRKKLSEQVNQLQEVVHRQESASHEAVGHLQKELDEAHKQIALLTQATTQDQLTRLPARGQAEKLMRELIGAGQPFSVAMAVIERLDLLNLRYGAESGDDVVRKFGQRLREQLPKRIFLCRWGGPAFVSVMERLPAGEVRAIMQKLLGAIAADPVEVQTKGSGLLHITSKFAVHQWLPGQSAEKVFRLVEIFCASERVDAAEGQEAEPPSAAT